MTSTNLGDDDTSKIQIYARKMLTTVIRVIRQVDFTLKYFLEDNTSNILLYIPIIKYFDNLIGGGTVCNLEFLFLKRYGCVQNVW